MNKKSYEKPRIETISARELVEMMGPVQGYGCPGITSMGPDAAVGGGTAPTKVRL
jgi:hypothetical protein